MLGLILLKCSLPWSVGFCCLCWADCCRRRLTRAKRCSMNNSPSLWSSSVVANTLKRLSCISGVDTRDAQLLLCVECMSMSSWEFRSGLESAVWVEIVGITGAALRTAKPSVWLSTLLFYCVTCVCECSSCVCQAFKDYMHGEWWLTDYKCT